MTNPGRPVGAVSVWASLLGLVLPLALAIAATALVADPHRRDLAYLLCVALFLVFELAAFVCRGASRRKPGSPDRRSGSDRRAPGERPEDRMIFLGMHFDFLPLPKDRRREP